MTDGFQISQSLIDRFAAGPPPSKIDTAKSLREDMEQALGSHYQVFLQGSSRNHTGVAELNDVDIVALAKNVGAPSVNRRPSTRFRGTKSLRVSSVAWRTTGGSAAFLSVGTSASR